MKKLTLTIICTMLAISILAQAPLGFTHQAVIRDAANELVINSPIGVKVSIIQGSTDGVAVYSETHTPNSNANGLITFLIGQGTIIDGLFAEIDWANGPYFIEVKADPAGYNNYTISGTTQLQSVPFAFFTNLSQKAITLKDGSNAGEILYWNGEEWLAIQPGQHAQILRFCEGIPVWGPCSPIVETAFITDVLGTTATGGGNIIEDGGANILARGVVWNTSENPSLDNNIGYTEDGLGTGSYVSNITGLLPETNYFVRAYAFNIAGISYGSQESFITGQVNPPSLTTLAVLDITGTTATSGGSISNHGGAEIITRGVVWSTTENPTLENNDGITEDGSGTGQFTSNIINLIPEMDYYLRAYASNFSYTAYGNQLFFSTADWSCGDQLIDQRDGKQYSTVLIGDQCWMSENMNHGVMIDLASQPQNNSIIEKSCRNNDSINCEIFGGLYQYHEMMQYATTDGTQGICPPGWHLPSDMEWTQLTNHISGGAALGGNQLKSCRQVDSPLGGDCDTDEHPRWAGVSAHHGTDEYGFSGLPSNFDGLKVTWWSTTEYSLQPLNAWSRVLRNGYADVSRDFYGKESSRCCVRCIKDDPGYVILPSVSTSNVIEKSHNYAIIGGNVMDDGGSEVVEHGVFYSLQSNPETTGIKFTIGSGIGEFSDTLTNLLPATTYYIKAFATSNIGTALGLQTNFTTEIDYTIITCPEIPSITYGGQVYNPVQIGTQCWLRENLNYDTLSSECYGGLQTNCDAYGRHYNWNDAMIVCPPGWHLPTLQEWELLIDFAGGLSNAGSKLKSIRTEPQEHPRWDSPNPANNQFGFEALPGGSYLGELGKWGRIWTATKDGTRNRYFVNFNYSGSNASFGSWNNLHSKSVRCIKDDYVVTTTPVTGITAISAIGGGVITDEGGTPINSRGVVYSTLENPTIDDNEGMTIDGSGIGDFVSYLNGLSPLTTYYVKAYATNLGSVVYGEELSFTTTEPTLPAVSTTMATNISANQAFGGGNVINDGGSEVTYRGVVWSINENPSIEYNQGITIDGTGIGYFVSVIDNLTLGVNYYFRAYATNSVGTSYGDEYSFYTSPFECGISSIIDTDGNLYNTLQINDQCWIKENLKTTKYSNGSPINYPGDNNSAWASDTLGAYAWYDNDLSWKESYGAFYNWHAVNNSSNLCPHGWSVPSESDWNQLINYIGGFGNKMKSCRQIDSPLGDSCNTTLHPRWEFHITNHGTDEYGFSALPGGHRYYGGTYNLLGSIAYFWSATEENSFSAKYYSLDNQSEFVILNSLDKRFGYSVRCIKY